MGVELDNSKQVKELASHDLLCRSPARLCVLLQPTGLFKKTEEENREHSVLLHHPLPGLLLQRGLEVSDQAEESLVGRLLLVQAALLLPINIFK